MGVVSSSGSSVLAGRLALLSGGIALGVFMAAGAAYAQQADRTEVAGEDRNDDADQASGNSTLLDRVVIGAGLEKVAIDTPQAVTVLDQEAIDAEQPMTIGEIFRQVPGVTVVGSDRVAGQSFNIRGIGDLTSADESKIIVSVDGAVKFYEQYRVGSFFSDPELYKRVEVLRGPASSTLYGAGAIGGVVNFTTKDASDLLADGQTGAVRLKTMYDSNKAGVLASLTAAYAFSEQTEVLLNGNFRRSNDYDAGGGIEVSGSAFKSFSGLAKVTHRFGVNNEQVLRLSYERWQSNDNDTDYSQTGTFPVFGTIDRDITDQTAVLSYENPASDNPWLDLKINLSVSDTQVWQGNASAPILSPLFADSDYGYRTYAARVENTFEWTGESYTNHLTVGAQGSYQERTATTTMGPASFHPEGTDTKFGVFFQNEFTWNDRLTIIPGARVDFITLDPANGIVGASTRNETAFSPKLAAMYKLNETFSLFGSVAHTERVPTLDELFSSNAPNGDYPGGRTMSLGLQKETSNAVEAGFAISGYDLVRDGDSLQLKTTAFFNDLRDMIVPNPNTGLPTPVTYYQNVTHAQIYGVEVEAAYDADYAFASLAYSHVHGEDKSTGATLNTIPADTLAMTLGAKIPQYDLAVGWRGLFAGSISTGATPGPFAGYAVHDLFADWKPDEGTLAGLEFRASVENLFDKRYQNNLAGDDGKGRTFKLTLAKTIGW